MSESYYGRPIVKPHVWTPYIPLYFWIGGTAGAAAVQTAIARLSGNDALATVQKRVVLAGVLTAPVLLIVDLGVPKRFVNMLRVFKPTSPMNAGSWILTAFGAAVGASTLAELLGWKRTSTALEVVAAAVGPALATYTAVLLSDTATPVWHEALGDLPFVFVASGAAGAGALGAAFTPSKSSAPARRMMIAGALGTVRATHEMERHTGPLLSEPYRMGHAGRLKQASSTLALAGALLGVIARRNRLLNVVAAACVASSGLCERFAILDAGKQSALDPKYVVEPQRARLKDAERDKSVPR